MGCCAVDTLGGVPVGSLASSPLARWDQWWHFTSHPTSSEGWDDVVASGGTVLQGTPATSVDARHPGTRDFTIDFAAGGSRANYRRHISSFLPGSGIWEFWAIVQVVAAPFGVGFDDYTATIGYASGGNADPAVAADGFGLGLRHLTSATNWVRYSSDGAATTVVDTGIAFTVGAWQLLRSRVNGAGTSIDYFITNPGAAEASAGTIATNIPNSGTGSRINVAAIGGAAGATRVFSLDWWREVKEIDPASP